MILIHIKKRKKHYRAFFKSVDKFNHKKGLHLILASAKPLCISTLETLQIEKQTDEINTISPKLGLVSTSQKCSGEIFNPISLHVERRRRLVGKGFRRRLTMPSLRDCVLILERPNKGENIYCANFSLRVGPVS